MNTRNRLYLAALKFIREFISTLKLIDFLFCNHFVSTGKTNSIRFLTYNEMMFELKYNENPSRRWNQSYKNSGLVYFPIPWKMYIQNHHYTEKQITPYQFRLLRRNQIIFSTFIP